MEKKAAQQPPLEAGLHAVIDKIRRGEWDDAAMRCDALLRAHGPHPAVLQMIGWLRLEQGDFGAARVALADALARRPGHLPTLMLAARAARAAGDLSDASRQANTAMALAPNDPEPALFAALLLHDSGQPDEAAARLQAVVHRHPMHAAAWYEWGRALRSVAESQRPRRQPEHLASAPARQAFERAVALAPSLLPAWFALALCAQDDGDLDAAATALCRVLQLDPARADAEVNLGLVLQEAGHFEDSMQAYGRAYRLREETFGRIAHALANAGVGGLWLDLDALREQLAGVPA